MLMFSVPSASISHCYDLVSFSFKMCSGSLPRQYTAATHVLTASKNASNSCCAGFISLPAFSFPVVLLCADPHKPLPRARASPKQTHTANFFPGGRAPQPTHAARLRDLQGRSDGVPGILSPGRDGQAVQLGAVPRRRRSSALAVQGARPGESSLTVS